MTSNEYIKNALRAAELCREIAGTQAETGCSG